MQPYPTAKIEIQRLKRANYSHDRAQAGKIQNKLTLLKKPPFYHP